jgi:hypothetical protein
MAKDTPLMHQAQLQSIVNWVTTEIEFAFSVENGGRYNRNDLRRRMRFARRQMENYLTERPKSDFGMADGGSGEDENEDAALTEAANAPDNENEPDLFDDEYEEEDDEEEEDQVEGTVLQNK